MGSNDSLENDTNQRISVLYKVLSKCVGKNQTEEKTFAERLKTGIIWHIGTVRKVRAVFLTVYVKNVTSAPLDIWGGFLRCAILGESVGKKRHSH